MIMGRPFHGWLPRMCNFLLSQYRIVTFQVRNIIVDYLLSGVDCPLLILSMIGRRSSFHDIDSIQWYQQLSPFVWVTAWSICILFNHTFAWLLFWKIGFEESCSHTLKISVLKDMLLGVEKSAFVFVTSLMVHSKVSVMRLYLNHLASKVSIRIVRK